MTHPMNLDVFPSLFHDDWNTLMTFHLMPYNFQVLSHVDGMQSIAALEIFINSAFPDIPKTTVHNYEALKTGEPGSRAWDSVKFIQMNFGERIIMFAFHFS